MTLGVALSSLLLMLQLRMFGSTGSVLEAGKEPLAASVGNIMMVSGVLCILALVVLARNRGAVAVAGTPAASEEAPAAPGAP
jgi:hypothetical protein